MTLIELLVVVLILGILVTVGMPQYFRVVEKGRIAEVTNYVGNIKKAQDRFALARGGAYAPDINSLDLPPPQFKAFSPAAAMVNGNTFSGTGWQITFTRNTSPGIPAPYPVGGYTVIYNGLTGNFSSSDANVIRDMLP
jgi:prepilin-type N-terminal cleavage/methylation domain-containing protein